jgi:hypothetical protein
MMDAEENILSAVGNSLNIRQGRTPQKRGAAGMHPPHPNPQKAKI